MSEEFQPFNEYNRMQKWLESNFATALTKFVGHEPDYQLARATVKEQITKFMDSLIENDMLPEPGYTVEVHQEEQELILTITGPQWLIEKLDAARAEQL